MDVWSEYAACRSSAIFRSEAVEGFEGIFCRAFEECCSTCKERIVDYRRGGADTRASSGMALTFWDAFICAGYFLGHLDGLELSLEENALRVSMLLRQRPENEMIVTRLGRVLHELCLTEPVWKSIEVFAPIYDLVCEMMTLHGFVFVQQGC